ncbi:MAG: hypothetical protein GX417_09500 [Clostridiales bacterium]|nr:hypothetical protein [Clostridiales bacterium]
MSILLYHGSPTGGIRTLQPFTADHGKPYVYFTTSDVSAALYAARVIERPYYWVPYGYDAQGRITYTEVWKNAFADVFSRKKGYLYCCEADDKALLRFPTHQSLRLSQKAMSVSRADTIEDLGDWFLRREQEGRFVIQRYETLTPAALSLWHGLVLEELKESFSGGEVENAYTRFVQDKFPAVWERFQTEMQ